jgi:ATP-dependent DNA ligase
LHAEGHRFDPGRLHRLDSVQGPACTSRPAKPVSLAAIDGVMVRGPAPMLLHHAERFPLDVDRWRMEPKWDGFRCLVVIGRNGPSLFSRRTTPFKRPLPYVEPELATLGPGVILDGELVALAPNADGEGVGQEYARVGAILSGRGPHQPNERDPKLHLVCFDVLERAGRELDTLTYNERRKHLDDLLREPRTHVHAVTADDPEPALLDSLLSLGFEGVVFKRRDSPYRRGVRSREWLKWKASREVVATVFAAERHRQSHRLERASVIEDDRAEPQWAVVRDARLRRELATGMRVRVRYTHRTAKGRMREACVVDVAA